MKQFWEVDKRIAELERERRRVAIEMKAIHNTKSDLYKVWQEKYDKLTLKIHELNWVLYE